MICPGCKTDSMVETVLFTSIEYNCTYCEDMEKRIANFRRLFKEQIENSPQVFRTPIINTGTINLPDVNVTIDNNSMGIDCIFKR